MKKILVLILVFSCVYSIVNAESNKDLFDNGVQHFKQGRYQKAIDSFSKLIEIEPGNADAYKNRGVTYMKLEKFDQAITDLEKAKSLFPELKGLYSNLGVAWYYKKEYEKAIEYYNTEIEMAPENAIVYFNRALCLTELGKNDQAIEDLSRTLELRPDFYWAICYKADIFASQGRNADAIKTYKKAIELAPENIYAIDKLAQLEKKIQNSTPQTIDISSTRPQEKDSQEPGELKPEQQKTDKQIQNKTADLPGESSSAQSSQTLKYAVQLGAFLNQENAQKMKSKLLSNGFDCRILIRDKKGKTWHMVRSGGYPDRNAARKAVDLIKQELNMDSIIRPYAAE